LLALAALPLGAAARDAEPAGAVLTLDEAVGIALVHNPTLAAEDAAARAAAETVRESRASRWPTVSVITDATRTTNPVAVFGQLLTQEEFGPENFAIDSLNDPDPLNNVRGVLSVSQPLWAGGRIDAGIDGAERQADAARQGRERARQELVYRVTDRYTGAVVAARAVEVRREGLEVARESVKLTRDLYEAGLVVESDLLQARVRESEAEAALADAEAGAQVARSALNLELGRALDTPMTLPESVDLPAADEAAEAVELAALIAEATDRRPDLGAAQARVQAARAGVRRARGGRLPEIGWSGAFEADSEEPFDDPGSNWTVGVGLRWTAFDGFATSARVERARAELDRAERLAERAEQGIALEVEAALEELHTARLRWDEAVRSVELARRSAAIVQDRYKEGLTTVVELLQAQTLETGSRVRELRARRDLAMARAGLDLALGRADGPAADEGGRR
jgi:outer membrane protein TolC